MVATRLQRPDPAQADGAALVGRIAGPDGLDRRRFGKGNVGSSLPLIEPVIAEGDPRVGRSDRQERAASSLVAADLEDVGRVVTQLEDHVDGLVVLREVDDPDPLLKRVVRQQPVAGDAELLADEALARVDLVVRVSSEGRICELDDAAIVRLKSGVEFRRKPA